MNPLIWIAAALGAIAVVRRKHLRDDARRLRTAASDAKSAATQRIAARRGGAGEGDADESPVGEPTGEVGADEAAAGEAPEEGGEEGDGETDPSGGESAPR